MKISRTKGGFTLIETMVAVTVVALAIAGPLTAASRALVAGQISQDQLVASYLSQEGVEYIREIRDNAFLYYYPPDEDTATEAWSRFLNSGTNQSVTSCISSTCTLDPAKGFSSALQACSGTGCTPLYLSNGIYTQDSSISGAVKTPFTRTVKVSTLSGGHEVRVVSTVSWMFHGSPYSITTTDHLTPWQ